MILPGGQSYIADEARGKRRAVAKQTGLSQSSISRILCAFGLQSHRQETFKFSSDPLLVVKTRDRGRLGEEQIKRVR